MAVAVRRTLAFLAIVLLAAALRFPALEQRPMHADEAIHAAKVGRLLEQGVYQYDPDEYHGPTLYYLSLIPARLRGITRYADLDEVVLRSVPATAGVLLLLAHALLIPIVGFRAAAIAALLTAVSPAMVYYNRYFIQETLLVAFSFAAILSMCRYLRSPGVGWAIGFGASLGLMFASKETWVIAAASMAGAAFLAWVLAGPNAAEGHRWRPPAPVHLAACGLAFLATWAVLFSSFFTHPSGLIDSLAAYTTYVKRAGASTWHIHPWHFYLGLLLYSGGDGAPVWSEAAIFGLATTGFVVIVRRHVQPECRPALVFLAGYAVLMTVIYSAIPYKTPWCVLGFLHGLILVAGVGAARLTEMPASRIARLAVSGAAALAVLHLGWLAWSASYRFASDPRNPYVYAHTGTGVFEIVRAVEVLARVHPDHDGMPIEVISGRNLWPLPWYLRRFSTVRWETAPVNDGVHAPVILGTPDMEAAIVQKLYEWRRPGERELYVSIFDHPVDLRPAVEVRGYAARSLWERAQAP
jgi:uncharacterized protein (TIGR03663 family)